MADVAVRRFGQHQLAEAGGLTHVGLRFRRRGVVCERAQACAAAGSWQRLFSMIDSPLVVGR